MIITVEKCGVSLQIQIDEDESDSLDTVLAFLPILFGADPREFHDRLGELTDELEKIGQP